MAVTFVNLVASAFAQAWIQNGLRTSADQKERLQASINAPKRKLQKIVDETERTIVSK
jgi:hypothetical protein